MNFHTYIHAVGTGHKSNRDLSYEESVDMMTQILNQSVHSEQIAAFLLGWRMKPESTTEFRGALEACDIYTKKINLKDSLELGYPFDGKTRNPYIFPLVAKILEAEKLDLVISGDVLQPAKGGITTKDICENIKISSNLHYFDRANFCKKLHHLSEIRNRLGLRTAFNTIEKLPHVTNSKYAITGVFHKPYIKKYIDIFSDRYDIFALIQGNEGTPELFSKGRLWISKKGNLKEYKIDPKDYGIDYQKSKDKTNFKESVKQILKPTDEFKKLATLNAAIFLFVCERASSIEEAYEKLNSKEILTSKEI